MVQGIYSIIVGVSFTNGINTTTTATTAEDCKLLSLQLLRMCVTKSVSVCASVPTATPQRIRTDSDVEYVEISFEVCVPYGAKFWWEKSLVNFGETNIITKILPSQIPDLLK